MGYRDTADRMEQDIVRDRSISLQGTEDMATKDISDMIK
jgi:hypothetical protein